MSTTATAVHCRSPNERARLRADLRRAKPVSRRPNQASRRHVLRRGPLQLHGQGGCHACIPSIRCNAQREMVQHISSSTRQFAFGGSSRVRYSSPRCRSAAFSRFLRHVSHKRRSFRVRQPQFPERRARRIWAQTASAPVAGSLAPARVAAAARAVRAAFFRTARIPMPVRPPAAMRAVASSSRPLPDRLRGWCDHGFWQA